MYKPTMPQTSPDGTNRGGATGPGMNPGGDMGSNLMGQMMGSGQMGGNQPGGTVPQVPTGIWYNRPRPNAANNFGMGQAPGYSQEMMDMKRKCLGGNGRACNELQIMEMQFQNQMQEWEYNYGLAQQKYGPRAYAAQQGSPSMGGRSYGGRRY